jgi:hypothetical protein
MSGLEIKQCERHVDLEFCTAKERWLGREMSILFVVSMFGKALSELE